MVPHTKFNLKNSRWNLNLSGVRNRVGVDDTSSVPTVAQRSGDLSGLLTGANPTVIYNPYTLVNGTNQPFPNNMIPASLISPTALALLNYYPLPTGPGTTNNYQLIRSEPSNNTNFGPHQRLRRKSVGVLCQNAPAHHGQYAHPGGKSQCHK
jgi:hypothetical protein